MCVREPLLLTVQIIRTRGVRPSCRRGSARVRDRPRPLPRGLRKRCANTVPGPVLTAKGDSWPIIGPHFLLSLEAASDLCFYKTDSDAGPTDEASGLVPHG